MRYVRSLSSNDSDDRQALRLVRLPAAALEMPAEAMMPAQGGEAKAMAR